MSDPFEIPAELPAMTLPEVVFFPKAMMPLRIFEQRYRSMLSDILKSHRMFALIGLDDKVTDEDDSFEPPFGIASAGIVRFCKTSPDGTSQLLLQGLSRIRICDIVREEPYRVVAVEGLASLLDQPLATRRAELSGLLEQNRELGGDATDEMIDFLNPVEDDEAYVDLVAFTLCREVERKQRLLETLELSERFALLCEDIRDENERLRLLKDALGGFPDEDFDAN